MARHHSDKRQHGGGHNSGSGHHGDRGHGKHSPPPTGRSRGANSIGTSCPRCFTVSNAGARFCHECGGGLTAIACTQCGSGMPSGTRFCGQCGTSAS
ncbi:zinc ribbon domain-containing protein [Herbaspirillum huttiense]|uniref:zinc ribbon domain-containing protein n=1 Tax=Herbaspirillum TaxID=963 RepID=UPI0039AFDFC4|nr:zinc ribbon domain-containing protein [Herbaspirillum sp. C7C2]